MGTIFMTASSLRAILCYIDPVNTPIIAYDNDKYALPLIYKIKTAVGDRDGSQSVTITFSDDEKELARQFNGVVGEIKKIFEQIEFVTRNKY